MPLDKLNGPELNATEAAHLYQENGFMPLPVREGKNPGFKNWQRFRTNKASIPHDFRNGVNVGLLLGEPSGWLVDIDLDWPEARALASEFLPQTSMVSGRNGSPRSHFWYLAQGAKTEKFIDPALQDSDERAMIVELRSTGGQTVVAPSIHPSGDRYAWSGALDPAKVDSAELRQGVSRLATCSLIARHWHQGKRHDLALTLSGVLLRAGWTPDATEQFVLCAARAAGDDQIEDRARAIQDTIARFKSGATITGLPTLSALIGEAVAGCLKRWLHLPTISAESVQATQNEDNANRNQYTATPNGIYWNKPTRDGFTPVPVSNFAAEIKADVTEDDGTEERHVFEIEVRQQDLIKRTTVSIEEFNSSRWGVRSLGASGVIYPNMSEHLRCATQLLSSNVERRRVFTHTGWRQIDGVWVYLHGGGAIGPEGAVSANVHLEGILSEYRLPEPPSPSEWIESINATHDLILLNEETITIPILGAVFCAVLGGADFSTHLEGHSGAGKTELAAIAQSFFGAGFNSKRLPGSWASSANSLELLAHHAKDTLFVIDDFKPGGTSQDKARLNREADRILRAQGNHAGRARLSRDGSLRMDRPPRGLILSTGEDIPLGESLRARLLILEAKRNGMNWPALADCRHLARDGVYAQAMAGFVRWLAPRYSQIKQSAQHYVDQARDEISRSISGHKRTPTTIAHLLRAWRIWLEAARDSGALDQEQVKQLWSRVWRVLLDVASQQGELQGSQEPTGRFLEHLTTALSSGRAYLVTTEGERPENPAAFGWQRDEDGRWRAPGKKIGWTKDDLIYLLPDAAYVVAHELSNSTGDPLALTPQTLWKRMNERGLLAAVDGAAQTFKIRRKIEGSEQRVIVLKKSVLTGELVTYVENPTFPTSEPS